MKSKTNNLLLPEKHLSWSQIELWQKDRREYQKIYFEGQERYVNAAMRYGQKFASMMETGQADDMILEGALLSVPKYEVSEYRLEAVLKNEGGAIPLLGYLDSSRELPSEGFLEYKTGKSPWTQKRVDNHGQLTLYAMMVFLRYNVVPRSIELHWLPTEEIGGEITLTGEHYSFKTGRTVQDVLQMMMIVKRTAGEISSAYREYISSVF